MDFFNDRLFSGVFLWMSSFTSPIDCSTALIHQCHARRLRNSLSMPAINLSQVSLHVLGILRANLESIVQFWLELNPSGNQPGVMYHGVTKLAVIQGGLKQYCQYWWKTIFKGIFLSEIMVYWFKFHRSLFKTVPVMIIEHQISRWCKPLSEPLMTHFADGDGGH